MDLGEARTAITEASTDRRLAGARVMARFASPQDLELLQDRVSVEEVPLVRRLLRDGLERLQGHVLPEEELPHHPGVTPEIYEIIYARAIEEVTHQVVHEIRTIVGTADYYASQLDEDYESTRANIEFTRLKEALRSVSLLGEAAKTPTIRQFDLADLVIEMAGEEAKAQGVEVQSVGPTPFLVTSDSGLVEIVLRNALRNACEATGALCLRQSISPDDRPVTVSWRLGDGEYLVSVLDQGPGLPTRRSRAWDIGVTTKKGHSGVGLPTARRAARSLDGRVDLRPAARGGAVFEFIFPAIGDLLV